MNATVERIRGRDIILVLGGLLLMADAFGLDLALPLDLAIGVPYALVVLLGLWWPRRGYIYTAAVVGSALCLLGFYLSFPGGELGPALINRSFALLTIWMVAALCLFLKQAHDKKLELQNLMAHVGQLFSGETAPRTEEYLFKNILESLLTFTRSRYGVIGEVLEDEAGRPYFQEKAAMAMDYTADASAGSPREEPSSSQEIEPYHTAPLFDEVIQSGKPLLMKHVSPAVNIEPLPTGHRPMASFMGLPFYHEGKMLGVVGLANRKGGYIRFWVEYLKPFLSASAGAIHSFRVGREKADAENALRENSETLQELETFAGTLQSAMDEKDARLADIETGVQRLEKSLQENEERMQALQDERDRGVEELSRVQGELAIAGETLRGKEEQVARAEENRNRTAQALWEKEERLMQVMDDFNQLEQGLKDENDAVARIEKDLKRVQEQLRAKDLKMEEIENRLGVNQDRLREKERRVAEIEDEMSEVEQASQEKDRRFQKMDMEKNDLERKLIDCETRLSAVEGELSRTKKILRDREEHLKKMGREIQGILAGDGEVLVATESERTKPQERVFQEAKDRPVVETEKNKDADDRLQEPVVQESGQGVCGLDLQGNTTFINPAGAKMLGYDSGELIGKNQHGTIHHSLIDGTPLPSGQCHICNTLSQGVVSHVVDEVFWRKDGSCFPVEYLSTPAMEADRQVGAVVTFSDISRRNPDEKPRDSMRIDFEQQVEAPRPEREKNNGSRAIEVENGDQSARSAEPPVREIERSNRDLQEFAAIASHDLQEPLRKIIGFGSRLKRDCAPALDDRGRDYLERMDRAAHKMQRFIGDLLQYSKVAGESVPYKRIDLNEVISEVLVDLESRIEETQAVVAMGDLPVLEADPTQMHQLFQNLIANALKFHKQGEAPVVSVSHRLQTDGAHEIRVEDQGIGFDEQHLERLFKPFERLHGRMEYEGTGMGLAICQKIVHRHRGEITATSSLEKGTTFVITLPARQNREKDLPE